MIHNKKIFKQTKPKQQRNTVSKIVKYSKKYQEILTYY